MQAITYNVLPRRLEPPPPPPPFATVQPDVDYRHSLQYLYSTVERCYRTITTAFVLHL